MTIVQGTHEALPIAVGSADLIVAENPFRLSRWDRWTLQQLGRLLAPEGALILSAPPGWRLSQWGAKALRTIAARGRRLRGIGGVAAGASSGAVYRGRALTWREHVQRLLQEIGFQEVTSSSSPFGVAGTILSCRSATRPISVSQRPIFADLRKLQERFQAHHGAGLERLEQWMLAHPSVQPEPPTAFESRVRLRGPAIVLSPHPDDELIGCGGALLRMRAAGAQVTIVQLTDGSASAALAGESPAHARSVRILEAEQVASELGAELVAWKEPDSRLEASESNIRRLAQLIAERRPSCIFVPFLADPHPDHIASTKILAGALEICSLPLDQIMIASYEVWGLAPVNAYCAIHHEFDRRGELLLHYRTAMKVVDYLAFCESLHGMRHVSWTGRAGFAEAFHVATASDYLRLFHGVSAPRRRAA